MSELVEARFGGADLAAAAAPATANLPIMGLPDVADTAVVQFPFPVEILGVVLSGGPAAGDTVTAAPFVGAGPAAAGLQAVISNAAPSASVMMGSGKGVAVAAFTNIGAQYKTTTGGTYGARDLVVVLLIKTPDYL